ncbi:MAG: cell envelope biogenesis protein OmpA [Rhodospirillales bacterium]|jgi:hypothetical protein|nr:cell envelope biogenesis protein OmpA [Rhodospirillales bacterium]
MKAGPVGSQKEIVMLRKFALPAALLAALATSACTNPNDPTQRGLGGALIGAGSGAAIGAIAGGGQGAAIGAGVGALVGGAAGVITTPQPQPHSYPPQQK